MPSTGDAEGAAAPQPLVVGASCHHLSTRTRNPFIMTPKETTNDPGLLTADPVRIATITHHMRRKPDMPASPTKRSDHVKTIVTLGVQETSVGNCLGVRLENFVALHVMRDVRKVAALSVIPTVVGMIVNDVLQLAAPITMRRVIQGRMTVLAVMIESLSHRPTDTIETIDAFVVVMSLLSTTSKSDDRREIRYVQATKTSANHCLHVSPKQSEETLLPNCVISGSRRQRHSKTTSKGRRLRGKRDGAREVPSSKGG